MDATAEAALDAGKTQVIGQLVDGMTFPADVLTETLSGGNEHARKLFVSQLRTNDEQVTILIVLTWTLSAILVLSLSLPRWKVSAKRIAKTSV